MRWERAKIGDVLHYEQPTKYIVSSEDYNDVYTTPVLTAGKSFVLGYTNETSDIYTNLPAIIFDDFTTTSKFVDFPFKVKSSAMKILTCNKEVADIRYMFYLLQTIKVNASQHKRYWISKFAEIEIPLPPLHIQQQIADTLDKADALRQKDQQLLQKYDELAQSIFYDMFGDPVRNERNFPQKQLSDCCLKITDGTHFSPPNVTVGIPYITAKHVQNGEVDFYKDPTYVSQKDHDEIYNRCTPEKGDILYIKDGATTGMAAVNKYDFPFSMLSSLALLKPDKTKVSSEFLKFWLNNQSVKNMYINEYMAGAAIKRFTLQKIKSFKLNLPPVYLQKQFEEALQVLDQAKENVIANSKRSYALFERVSNDYFS